MTGCVPNGVVTPLSTAALNTRRPHCAGTATDRKVIPHGDSANGWGLKSNKTCISAALTERMSSTMTFTLTIWHCQLADLNRPPAGATKTIFSRSYFKWEKWLSSLATRTGSRGRGIYIYIHIYIDILFLALWGHLDGPHKENANKRKN